MIPIIVRIKKTHEYYKYGLRWMVRAENPIATRTFNDSYKHWKNEIKCAIPSWFFIEHDFYHYKYSDGKEVY